MVRILFYQTINIVPSKAVLFISIELITIRQRCFSLTICSIIDRKVIILDTTCTLRDAFFIYDTCQTTKRAFHALVCTIIVIIKHSWTRIVLKKIAAIYWGFVNIYKSEITIGNERWIVVIKTKAHRLVMKKVFHILLATFKTNIFTSTSFTLH